MKNPVIFFSVLMFSTVIVSAQSGSVGIGTSTPNSNASLDLGANNKGLLLNRVAITAANLPAPLAAHVQGMVVYNTATAGTSPDNVSPGIYYNSGSRWLRLEPAMALGFFARSAGSQAFTYGSRTTVTDWLSVRNDFATAFNGTTLTVPAGMGGWYSINASWELQNAGASGTNYRSSNNQLEIRVNGITVVTGYTHDFVTGGVVGGNPIGVGTTNASIGYFLNDGDQVTIRIYHQATNAAASNAAVNVTALAGGTWFSVLRL
ncbi:MAG TPA: hypothetical protein VEC12_15180 [Bacteroidia bacterium]|nr:hypothetical protein [Bacteroidia bacterium]